MTIIEQGFRRGWADACERYESAALRFIGDFLTGYFEGYRLGRQSGISKKTLEESIRELKDS